MDSFKVNLIGSFSVAAGRCFSRKIQDLPRTYEYCNLHTKNSFRSAEFL